MIYHGLIIPEASSDDKSVINQVQISTLKGTQLLKGGVVLRILIGNFEMICPSTPIEHEFFLVFLHKSQGFSVV